MKRVWVAALGVSLMAGSAWAVPFGDGGALLQSVLDGITVGGPSSVNVATDEIADNTDSHWTLTASGGSVSTLIIELAGFANQNVFGIYDAKDSSNFVQVFNGAASAGAQATVSIKVDGSVFVNNADSGVDFAGNLFGYYLDSSANNGGGFFYSDTLLNSDGLDHMAAYQGTGDTVQLPGLFPGVWTANEYILAFEDLLANVSDRDYTDFVLMVESVSPVPEPTTMILLGSGLLGLAGVSRRKKS